MEAPGRILEARAAQPRYSSGPTSASGSPMFSGNEFKSTHSRIPTTTAPHGRPRPGPRWSPAPCGVATSGDAVSSSSSSPRTSAEIFQGFGENTAVGRSRNGELPSLEKRRLVPSASSAVVSRPQLCFVSVLRALGSRPGTRGTADSAGTLASSPTTRGTTEPHAGTGDRTGCGTTPTCSGTRFT